MANDSANNGPPEGPQDASCVVVSHPARLRRPGKPPGHPRPEGSGRRPGTPNKTTREIRAVAQKHGPKAIKGLLKLATTADREETRLKAWQELLDRGYGRPVSPTQISGPGDGPVQTEDLTDSPSGLGGIREQARQVALLLTMAGGGGTSSADASASFAARFRPSAEPAPEPLPEIMPPVGTAIEAGIRGVRLFLRALPDDGPPEWVAEREVASEVNGARIMRWEPVSTTALRMPLASARQWCRDKMGGRYA